MSGLLPSAKLGSSWILLASCQLLVPCRCDHDPTTWSARERSFMPDPFFSLGGDSFEDVEGAGEAGAV